MNITSKTKRILKTVNLYICFLCMGMSFSVPGPTLIDLTCVVQTSIKNVYYIYVGRSIGILLGSIIGGIIFDMTEKKLTFLTLFSFLTSVSMIGIPFSRQIILLSVWMVVNGFSLGALLTSGNVYCLSLWGKNNGPFYQALHLAFGVGGFIAPLIASPFLENFSTEIDVNNSTVFNNQMINETQLDHQVQNISSISNSSIPPVTYPYIIIGAFSLFGTILFFITCIKSSQNGVVQKNTGEPSNERNKLFTCTMLLLTALIVFMSMGTEIAYGQMLTTYAVKGSLQLLTTTGSYMTSGYWISFTISRFITIFLMLKLTNMQLFSLNGIIIFAGSLILVLLARYYIWALWLATVLIGSGISFFFPAVVSWLDKYITVTSKKLSILAVTMCAGEMLMPYIISQYIEDTPEVFSYVNVISCMLILILVIVMYLMLRNTPDKYSLQNHKTEEKATDICKEDYM